MAAPSTCEGIRMTKLREVLDKTLEEFFKSAQSPELIARCFPQLSQEYGEHIADLFAQATSFIRDNTLVRAEYRLHICFT